MNSATMTTLLQSVAYLCALLLIGVILRNKIPIFGRLMLPASVIGGFVGLLLGPNVLGQITGGFCLPVPEDFLKFWAVIPGILIVPIFAAAPLGNGLEPGHVKTGMRKTLPRIMMACGGFAAIGCLQGVTGFGTNLLFKNVFGFDHMYRTFGNELPAGFAGGHGTAAGLGGIYESLGIAEWNEAMGVGTTCATVGLLGGMLLGILVINRAAEKGQLVKLSGGKKGEIPLEIRRGVNPEIEKQGNIGRETTQTSCIDTVTVHIALILVGCGIAYIIRNACIASSWAPLSKAFSSIPVWFVALLVMYGVNYVLKVLKLNWLVDKKVKSRVTGSMSDIAITAAVASCNVKAVMTYIVPILVMCALGFIVTFLGVFTFNRWLFKGDYPVERSVICWGANTGVMITGMMLLKIADPDYETPALSEFAAGFAMMSILSIFTSPITYGILATGSTTANLLCSLGFSAMYFGIAIVGKLMYEAGKKKEKA